MSGFRRPADRKILLDFAEHYVGETLVNKVVICCQIKVCVKRRLKCFFRATKQTGMLV